MVLWLAWPCPGRAVGAADESVPVFGDRPLQEPVELPDWFKLSFLDLLDDLQEARDEGKKGLILYFGQEYCPYCQALIRNNWGRPDITAYTRRHFDVIHVDVHGDRLVTDFDGRVQTEREFARRMGATLTPTLVFYDQQGRVALKLVGYYPPYEFQAALVYVAEGYYLKEGFRDYLARAEGLLPREVGTLNEEPFFERPPYILDRSRFPAQRPLLVLFEQADCHACDILHAEVFSDSRIRELLDGFDVVQLDLWADTPVVTPGGKRTTAAEWARQLGLFYTPTLIFYDQRGREIIRLDSVAYLYRLRSVLTYVLSGGYRDYPDFQDWRRAQGKRGPSAPDLD